MMSIMTIFDAVIILIGIYMMMAAYKMKKNSEISATLVTAEEIEHCRDKAGFINYIYWKEAVLGGVIILVGILGIIDELMVSLGKFNIVEMLVFFAAFLWFQRELRSAREQFFKKF